MRRRGSILLLAGILLLLPTLACGLAGGGGEPAAATAAAISQAVAATATAAAANPGGPDVALATLEARATAERAQAEAAQATAAAQGAVDAAATAQALVPIQTELAGYGIDPAQGRLGWIHEPVTLAVEGYLQYDFANRKMGTIAQDFVMAADITWNTRFGTTGCGFVVRSDGNEEGFSQYLIIATRGASGHVGFITQQTGDILQDGTYDIYANGIDPLFEWQNDTTNRLVVIGRGDRFTIYTNGTLIGEIDAAAGYTKGFNAFVALNESGDTTCVFENAWLWLLN